MRLTTKYTALAAAAVLAVAACSDDSDADATDDAAAALEQRVVQLEGQVQALGAGSGEDSLSGDADLSGLESRLSEVEDQVELLVAAVEEMQDPSRIGISTSEPDSSPEATEESGD